MGSHFASGQLVTLLSIIAALYYAAAVVRSRGRDQVSNTLHTIMYVAMAVMPWAWYTHVPVPAQVLFFSGAAAWFTWCILYANDGDQHHDRAVALGYHATMMIAMVWMAMAMSPLVATAGSAEAMSAMGHLSSGHAAGVTMIAQEGWALPVSWVLGILFVLGAAITALVTIARLVRADDVDDAIAAQLVHGLADTVGAAALGIAFLAWMT